MGQVYRELMTVTGDFARVQIFPVRSYRYGRQQRRAPTRAAQERLNRENRARRLSDIINLNFTERDVQLKLDYSSFRRETGRNPDPCEVIREMRNFIRRVKRLYASLGLGLKYVYCSEVGARGRISHHHVIMSGGISPELIRSLWHCGGVWSRRLFFNELGCYELAGYFVKSQYTYRSYTCSKNLVRPSAVGEHRCIFADDSRIGRRQLDAFICGDAGALRRLYPGWELASLPDVAQTVDLGTGEPEPVRWGIFISLFLYRPDARVRSQSSCAAWRQI